MQLTWAYKNLIMPAALSQLLIYGMVFVLTQVEVQRLPSGDQCAVKALYQGRCQVSGVRPAPLLVSLFATNLVVRILARP